MTETVAISVTINGTPYDKPAEPRLNLADYLRNVIGLTGTHVGCEHGACGACTVRLSRTPSTGGGLGPAGPFGSGGAGGAVPEGPLLVPLISRTAMVV